MKGVVARLLRCLLIAGALAGPAGSGCRPGAGPRPLVVYAAQDETYAEPILQAFTRETGVPVRAVYDSEAVKTVGLANRLLAERNSPMADVFWGNEELRTRQLEAAGVFRATNGWIAFGQRTRRLVINTNLVSQDQVPSGLESLTNSVWRRRVAIAYPMFGSTSTHFMALRQRWGEARWLRWCRGLMTNEVLLVDGNSVVVKLVGSGQAAVGLTDSDDVTAGSREGLPIRALPPDADTLRMPNTAAIVRGRPEDGLADRLVAHLRSPATLEALQQAGAIESTRSPAEAEQTIHWDRLLQDLPQGVNVEGEIFLR